MKWIKASERLPEEHWRGYLKRKGKPSNLLSFFDSNCFRFSASTDYYDEYHFSDIEWLDEQSASPSAPSNDYWKRRCEAAEKFIEKSPCDPDTTSAQLEAYKKWQALKSNEYNQDEAKPFLPGFQIQIIANHIIQERTAILSVHPNDYEQLKLKYHP
jgi:hypothetical protein